jgi:2-aminoethylphosphonate-pyruvate transaminase
LYNISKVHNKNTHVLNFGWGKPMDISKIEKYIKSKKVDIIAMVHHETSIGMLNPAELVGRLSKKYNKIFYIDTVSSTGADEVSLEKWNVAFCTTSSGKAICSLPGLGIIMARRKNIEALKDQPSRTVYLNLYNLYKYSLLHKQTPNTPAVHLFYAFNQALDNILKTGVKKWRAEIKRKANILRDRMKEMKLEFLIDESFMSSALTTVKIPTYTTFEKLRKKLKEKDIVVYNGKGPFLNKVFQVGNIGQLTYENLEMFLESLEDALKNISKKPKMIIKPTGNLPFRDLPEPSHPAI